MVDSGPETDLPLPKLKSHEYYYIKKIMGVLLLFAWWEFSYFFAVGFAVDELVEPVDVDCRNEAVYGPCS